jgi:hypothetical protein
MKVTIEGQEYEVQFKHGSFMMSHREVWGTICWLLIDRGTGYLEAADGRSALHPLDYGRDDRCVGRRLAFGRALAQITDSKDERRLAWAQFFEEAPRHLPPALRETLPHALR